MKKGPRYACLALALICALCLSIAGCASESSSKSDSETSSQAVSASGVAQNSQETVPNGEYSVDVSTDSSMFHLNEVSDGKGTLTVADDGMTVHISLASKKIIYLYAGKVSQAEDDEANWLEPTEDTVTYDDGYTEEVYGFDIPVPVLDEPFDVAILGTKGNWYDHKVTVSSPESK